MAKPRRQPAPAKQTDFAERPRSGSAPARNVDAETCEPIALEYKNNSDDQQIGNVLVEPSSDGDAK
jgi:hypothetical protein